MNDFLGAGNNGIDYLILLLLYGAMFILIRYANRQVELSFRRSFTILAVVWGVGVFIGNYLFYLIGIMSFLPWLDNAFHTLIWIALCLTFLYAGCHRKPLWEQIALFMIFSFIIKMGERLLLGTWELDNFFGIHGNMTYIVGWSIMDGLYPFISVGILRLASKTIPGVVVPRIP